MNITEVRNVARQHNIKPGKLSKPELIRFIQAEEGNFDVVSPEMKPGLFRLTKEKGSRN